MPKQKSPLQPGSTAHDNFGRMKVAFMSGPAKKRPNVRMSYFAFHQLCWASDTLTSAAHLQRLAHVALGAAAVVADHVGLGPVGVVGPE